MDKLKTGISTNLDFIRFMKERGQTVSPDLPAESLRDQLDALSDDVKVTFESTNEVVLAAANGGEPPVPPVETVTITVNATIEGPVTESDINEMMMSYKGIANYGATQSFTEPVGTTGEIIITCKGYEGLTLPVTFTTDTTESVSISIRAVQTITFDAAGIIEGDTPMVTLEYADPDTGEETSNTFELPCTLNVRYGSWVYATVSTEGYDRTYYTFIIPNENTTYDIIFYKLHEIVGFTSFNEGVVATDSEVISNMEAELNTIPTGMYTPGKLVTVNQEEMSGFICNQLPVGQDHSFEFIVREDNPSIIKYVPTIHSDSGNVTMKYEYQFTDWFEDTHSKNIGFLETIQINSADELTQQFLDELESASGQATLYFQDNSDEVHGSIIVESGSASALSIKMSLYSSSFPVYATVDYEVDQNDTDNYILTGTYSTDGGVTEIDMSGKDNAITFPHSLFLVPDANCPSSATFIAQFLRNVEVW